MSYGYGIILHGMEVMCALPAFSWRWDEAMACGLLV
jgi:hypothetical protein